MKSRTSLFNRTIILNLWQRYWVLYAGYAFVLAMVVLPGLVNGFQSTAKVYQIPDYISVWVLLSASMEGFLVVNIIAAPVFATLLFSYLYNPRHTGLMGSLPVKRETIYLSVCTAAVAGMVLANLLVLALALLVELIYGGVHLGALGVLLGTSLLSMVAFFGMATLCCLFTGNIFAGPAVYVIFNFLAVLVEAMVNTLLDLIVFGYTAESSAVAEWLSPVFRLMNKVSFNADFLRDPITNESYAFTWSISGVEELAVYALVGALLLAVGWKLYVNRRMETAGDTIAIEALKPVFRFCMTVGAGMAFAIGFLLLFSGVGAGIGETGKAAFVAVLMIIGGTMGYFISKMLIGRTLRVFRSGWKTVGVYALGVVLVVTAVESDLFGYETHVPEVGEIENIAVHVYDGNGALVLEEPGNIADIVKLHKNIIANKDFHEQNLYDIPAAEPSGYYRSETVAISYVLLGGKEVSRSYAINYGPDEIRSTDSEVRLLERILNTEEAIYARNHVGTITEDMEISSVNISWIDAEDFEWRDFSDLSPSEMHGLYFYCVLPDILDGGMGEYSLILDKEWAQRTSTVTLSIDVVLERDANNRPNNYLYFSFNVDTSAKRTMAYLQELGVNACTKYEEAVQSGEDYNDLGQYSVDENGEWYIPEADTWYYEETAESVGIIGGADGPTEVIVN